MHQGHLALCKGQTSPPHPRPAAVELQPCRLSAATAPSDYRSCLGSSSAQSLCCRCPCCACCYAPPCRFFDFGADIRFYTALTLCRYSADALFAYWCLWHRLYTALTNACYFADALNSEDM